MIIVRINLHALSDKQKEVKQTLLSLMVPMELEPGCLSYAIMCDMKDKNLLCVLTEWKNREELDHHLKSDTFGILLGIRSLLRLPHGIHIYTVQRTEGMDIVRSARGK